MANITVDEVKRLAVLSRISVTDEEAATFAAEFEQIIGYFKQLQAIDTEGVEPTSQVTGLVNVSRTDEIREYGTTTKSLLKAAPASREDHLKVPRVL